MPTATVRVRTYLDITDTKGVLAEYEDDVSYTSQGDVKRDEVVISAVPASYAVWDPSDASERMATFGFLYMVADIELEVELTINEGDANEELNSFHLAAGQPFVLGSDVAYYNHSASDVWGGSADIIDKIRVNSLGTTAGTLFLAMSET